MNSFASPATGSICPVCGKADVGETWEDQTFPFGVDDPVELRVRVPVLTCGSCSFSFTDDRAAAIRHDEACRYQGLITPGEIRRLREQVYKMSRKEFERAFGASEASLERWENRKVFPSKLASVLLRLLFDQSVGQRALAHSFQVKATRMSEDDAVVVGRFPALTDSQALRARARQFKLRVGPMIVVH